MLAILCAFVQAGSAAVFSTAAVAASLPGHLPQAAGERIYRAIDRRVRIPFVEQALAEIALQHGRYDEADREISGLPHSAARSELQGRIDAARGNRASAIRNFLDAADIDAVGAEVQRLQAAGAFRQAYDLENSLRQRLLRTETHPDAVAESFWRSGELADSLSSGPGSKVQWRTASLAYFSKAHALAPFSEKYLLAAGTQALALHELTSAQSYFQQCIDLNPESANAYAGLGLVYARQGRPDRARALLEKSRAIDPQSTLIPTLQQELR